jgi:hypothetical protein
VVSGTLRILFAPINRLLTAFWDCVNGALRFLLDVPVIGDLLRLFFQIIAFPFEVLNADPNANRRRRPPTCSRRNSPLSKRVCAAWTIGIAPGSKDAGRLNFVLRSDGDPSTESEISLHGEFRISYGMKMDFFGFFLSSTGNKPNTLMNTCDLFLTRASLLDSPFATDLACYILEI